MPLDLMEVDDTSKASAEDIEGKYPKKQEGEEDDLEDPEELRPLPVFDPIAHDLESQDDADIWRDGVLCKRAWVYYWNKRIAKEVRGGILGIPDECLPCYERVARSPYFKPI